jgi:predicted metal-dependent HD superfamily phosphohydrolase
MSYDVDESFPSPYEANTQALWRDCVQRAWGAPAWSSDKLPPCVDDAFAILVKMYQEKHRAYHTLEHIASCLQILRTAWPNENARPDWYTEVELALWFHDVVYDSRRHDNEDRSARFLIGVGGLLGLPNQLVESAASNIRATTHKPEHAGIGFDGKPPINQQWVLDIDLASLGFSPDQADKHSAQIRKEYVWVPDDVYRPRRKAILQGFLARPRIYYTNHCFELFEYQARANLQRAIRALG